ncbi:hypothetical protein GCM10009741_44260 [Kribbella lupini]|uniref:Uncharacterized protein n=1 Tax=Kribbella lupini TaxID=291602 RepID=A0ABP4M3C1_9ACTN
MSPPQPAAEMTTGSPAPPARIAGGETTRLPQFAARCRGDHPFSARLLLTWPPVSPPPRPTAGMTARLTAARRFHLLSPFPAAAT